MPRPRPGTTLDSIASAARTRSVSRQVVRDGGEVLLSQPVASSVSLNHEDGGTVYRIFVLGLDNPDLPGLYIP